MAETNPTTPFFSVVLTTRNRAALLPFAVRSILAQGFGDFEIIISDNFSKDDTPEVARSFGDPRVSYVRTPESLPMSESYRFALGHARGHYVTFLSDDDAFSVGLMEKVKSLIDETKAELLCWKHCYYYLTEHRADDRPLWHPLRRVEKNSLLIPAFGAGLFEVDALDVLRRSLLNDTGRHASLLEPEPPGPLFTNAVYHRGLLDRISGRGLSLLRRNVVPDIYAAFVAGLTAGSYFFLDEPLTVFCVHGSSATANYAAEKTSMARQFEEAPGRERELLTPVKSFLNRNYYLNSILQALEDMGHGGNGAELNRKNYYLMFHSEMESYRERGVDVGRESEEFELALSGEPEGLQREVRAAVAAGTGSSRVLAGVRRLPRPSLVTRVALRLSPATIQHRSILVQGRDAGFQDIAGCAAWLDAGRIKELSDFCVAVSQGRPASLPFRWRIG